MIKKAASYHILKPTFRARENVTSDRRGGNEKRGDISEEMGGGEIKEGKNIMYYGANWNLFQSASEIFKDSDLK